MSDFTPQQIEQFLQEFFDVVGARQYVGARYVPIFGRAGSDTVEWDDLAPYEPLTVVMHDGVSYVSRRYVPAGIEITNTDYWVETYRFNAQVEQYRQQVLGFQDQIDQIRADYVPFPDSDHYPKYGTLAQVLTTLANGQTKWEDPVTVDATVAEPLINEWLDEHPEATTTVEDGSITKQKLATALAAELNRKLSTSYYDCTVIPNNTNYNTMTESGNYLVSSSAAAQSMQNCPTTVGHRLIVFDLYSTARLVQIVIAPEDIYIRYFNGTVFDQWTRLVKDDELPAYLPFKYSNYSLLAQGSDYNNIASGVWACTSTAAALSMINCPTQVPHILIVQELYAETRRMQWVVDADNNVHHRFYSGSGYTAWETIADLDVLDDYLTCSVSELPDGDLNDVDSNSVYLLTDSHTYDNIPIGETGWLFTFKSGGWRLQYFARLLGQPIYARRINTDNVPSQWVEITGPTTNNYTYNYDNTYNISTSPTITTDSNGWLQAIDTDTESEAGKTDMSGAIMSMLTSTGYCHLGEGIFYVNGGIDMPKGSTLVGCGDATTIRLLQSTTNGYCVRMSDYNTIKDVSFSGSYSDIATPTAEGSRDGVRFEGDYEGSPSVRASSCKMDNVTIRNFTGNGILCNETSISPEDGLYATNVYVERCYCGLNIKRYSEFNKITNLMSSYCKIGIINNGGNNVFTACTVRATDIGFYIDGSSPNSAHGSMVGCTFCHTGANAGSAITMENVTAGFVVSACQFWYNTVDLDSCQGIVFSGCEFGAGRSTDDAVVNINGGNLVSFIGCVFSDGTDINVTNNSKVKFDGSYWSQSGTQVTV